MGTGLLDVFTGWSPKFTLIGENFTTVPVPVSFTVCGLPIALSETDSNSCAGPGSVGVNVTCIWQLEPTLRVAGQLLVSLKGVVVEMLEIVTV